MKYLQRYVDRHGRPRTYFRRGDIPKIPLPEPGSPDFFKAYQSALREVGEPPRRIAIPMASRVRRRLTNQRPRIGVYLLIHKGKLVYIGSSKDMVARVAIHRQHGRQFDQAFYISTTEGERLPLEKVLIRDLQPGENHVGKKHRSRT